MVPELVPSAVEGAGVLRTAFHLDERGCFAKPFSESVVALVPDFVVREVFWSRSDVGVVRGLHFQYPPSAVAKIVFAVSGRIRDVFVDLRRDSPSFGRHDVIELDERAGAVYVPQGVAHGFEVLEGPAITCYLQDGPFDPEADAGIRWDSAGIAWAVSSPRLSPRDRALPPLASVELPERWTGV